MNSEELCLTFNSSAEQKNNGDRKDPFRITIHFTAPLLLELAPFKMAATANQPENNSINPTDSDQTGGSS